MFRTAARVARRERTMTSGKAYGFFRPYDRDRRGGRMSKHLSHGPGVRTGGGEPAYVSSPQRALSQTNIALRDCTAKPGMRSSRFVTSTREPGGGVKLRPRAEWGTIPLEPEIYGRSVLGAPLEVWRPRGAANSSCSRRSMAATRDGLCALAR